MSTLQKIAITIAIPMLIITSCETKKEPVKQTIVGEVMHTGYFDVTINKVDITDYIKTDNEYMDKKPDGQNYYVVLNTTFKNTDTESRMVTNGELYITYNNKEYKFDNPETIIADGYGIFLDQINPLASITTNVVYKIPFEVHGPMFYHPGRADQEQRIFVYDLTNFPQNTN